MGLENFNEISEGLKDHFSRGGVLESYTQSELNYIREIMPRNWDELSAAQRQETIQILDDRLVELSESGVAKALDSDPQIKQALSSVMEDIPVEKLEAPNDFVQIEQISDILSDVIKPHNLENFSAVWLELPIESKKTILTQLENKIAHIEHRPPAHVQIRHLSKNTFGAQKNGIIYIDINQIESSFHENIIVAKILNTLAHEGRHAYQEFNAFKRKVHPWHSEIVSWRDNFINYKDPREVGFYEYRSQPIEKDAWTFANAVIEKLNQKLPA